MPNWTTQRLRITASRALIDTIVSECTAGEGISFARIIPMPASLDVPESSTSFHAEQRWRALCALNGVTQPVADARDRVSQAMRAAFRSGTPGRDAEDEDSLTTWALEFPDQLAVGAAVAHNLQHFGHATWYGWNTAHWGTKWDANDSEMTRTDHDGTSVLDLHFTTAWSAPEPIYDALVERYPEARMVGGVYFEGDDATVLWWAVGGERYGVTTTHNRYHDEEEQDEEEGLEEGGMDAAPRLGADIVAFVDGGITLPVTAP